VNARDIVVFLGPSLALDDARRILPARYLGPARCGDVLRARRLAPRAIALVDGVFASSPATWHKEILLALEDGIAVYGASSMGALRAAELAPCGMVGVGLIYEAYRDGVYTDDDEVALLHGPARSDYRELSEAMVNIRATVAHAVACGIITTESAGRVIRSAKATFYQERSLAAAIDQVWAANPRAEEPRRFRRFLAGGGYVNQKRLDTLQLLARLGGRIAGRRRAVPAVPRTCFIVKLQYDVACRPVDVPDRDLPLDERVALESDRLGRLSPLLRRLSQMMAMVHALGGGGLDTADLADEAHATSVERLARIGAVVDDFARRHGARATARLQRRHVLNLIRLDGAYSRLLPACGPAATAGAARPAASRGESLELDIYRRLATLWAIIDERIERARVDFAESRQALSDDFRRARGLERRAATMAWRRANGLDRRGYERLLIMDARLGLVTAGAQLYALTLVPATHPAFWLVDAIRHAGLYRLLERRAQRAGSARVRGTTGGRTAA